MRVSGGGARSRVNGVATIRYSIQPLDGGPAECADPCMPCGEAVKRLHNLSMMCPYPAWTHHHPDTCHE